MLRKCPSHGFDDITQLHIFCNRLQAHPKLFLDATTGGSLMSKSVEDAISIIEQMTLNDLQVHYNIGVSQRKAGILEFGTNDAMLAQNKLLTQTVEEITKQPLKFQQ